MIDLNRGVTYRTHSNSGIQVYMYKDAPGVYHDANGEELDEKFAKQAGFPVEMLGKERERKAKIAEKIAEIDAAYGVDAGKVGHEKGGFKVVSLGNEQFQVVSPEGNVMTDVAITQKQAEKIVDAAAKDEKEDQ